jgi:hypothetical protein
MTLLEEAYGAAIQREMMPCGQDCLALRAEDLVRHCEHSCLAPFAVQR